jgi:hypothetical protein
MNSLRDNLRLRSQFRELRWPVANAGRGFVCVLDLRSRRSRGEWIPTGRVIAWAALLGLVIFLAGTQVPESSGLTPNPDATAITAIMREIGPLIEQARHREAEAGIHRAVKELGEEKQSPHRQVRGALGDELD